MTINRKTIPEISRVINQDYSINSNVLHFLYAITKNNPRIGKQNGYGYTVYPYGYNNRVLDNYELGIEVVMHSWDTMVFCFNEDGVYKAPYLENLIRSFGGRLKTEFVCGYDVIDSLIDAKDNFESIESICEKFSGFDTLPY